MTEPKKYRKKPVVIEAMQWDGTAENATQTINWILGYNAVARYIGNGEDHPMRYEDENNKTGMPPFLVITTLEGNHRADAGDYIIRGVEDEFYPCKPQIFVKTYESA